jgi:ornithine cyclodeaminase/alanine dehydrogenase-like protein (mu-crystallin family)
MRWVEIDSEREKKLRDALWMSEKGQSLLYLMSEKRVVLGDETYLFSGRTDRFDRLITMSSWIEFDNASVVGSKWVSSRSANLKMGLSRGGAVTVLNDGETGLPLLAYEGSAVSLARTAMVACVSLEFLFGLVGPKSVTLLGAGRVHDWQADYLRQLWPKIELFVYDMDAIRRKEFAKKHRATELPSLRDGLAIGEVLSLATAGSGSVGWLSAKDELVAKVLLNTSLRDIQPRVVSKFPVVVVDEHSFAVSQGTPYDLAWKAGWVQREVSLVDLVVKRVSISDFPVLVNPMGLPLWDVGIGYFLFRREFNEELKNELSASRAEVRVEA